MGLAQKRIVQEFETSKFAAWKEQFDKVTGFKVPMEVRWETMQSEDYSKRDDYFAWYEMVYFRPLMKVFQSLCADEMGKKAVKSSLKKIVIDGSEGSHPGASQFDKGVFTIKHMFSSNVDDVEERVQKWTEMLENAL